MDSPSGSDGSPTKDDPPLYEKLWGLMTEERMAQVMFRYGVPSDFIYRLPGDTECFSYPSPIEVAVCEEMFKVGFCLPLHLFIEHLLARYGLVPVQLHPNA